MHFILPPTPSDLMHEEIALRRALRSNEELSFYLETVAKKALATAYNPRF